MRAEGINRREFSFRATLAASAVGFRPAWAQTRLERSKVLIGLAGRSEISLLPLAIADRLGYFRAEGLDVELIDFPSSGSALQALLNGAVHVSASGYEQILNQSARGHFLQSFVLMAQSPAVAVGVSIRNLPHFKTVADLRGKKMGVGAPGSASHAIAHWVMARAGLTQGDVMLVHFGGAAEALAAFQLNQIDATSYGDPIVTMLEQKRILHLVADSRTMKGRQALFGGPLPGSCLYAHSAFVQQNPLTAQAMTLAVVRALRWIQTAGPSDLMKVIPEPFMIGDRALYLTAIGKGREAVSPDGVMPKSGPMSAFRVFSEVEPGFGVERIDLSKTYTNEFAAVAKAHFKV
ncbi:ABC transporter substrate-binding protein [Rhodoferax sp. PAMC 29310]|uniref:ABC transporter substrate-binding protein n=1 Tax=Rhodoferax sp. PAMC 29310 TaxID=2822760 RepID=UPI001B33BDBB|nr:ABC transporter substrate-binding protein [Rhodoferax sp. PAMC 29310]